LPSDCPGLTEHESSAMRRSAPYYVVARAIHPSENESYSRVSWRPWLSGRPAAADTNCLATSTAISHAGVGRSQFDEWISLFATIEMLVTRNFCDRARGP